LKGTSLTQDAWNFERAKNWHLFLPPARPSPGEVVQYEQAVLSFNANGFKDLIWGLLGSTPEIRSLAAKYHREILCIDRDKEVFEALRSLVNPRYPEKFICSDWLTAEDINPIDIFFADGSMNMLPPEKHEVFLKKIHDWLTSQGWFFIRVHLAGPPRFNSPQEAFVWHRKNTPKEPVFTATRTDLDMLWLEPETLKLNFVEFHKKIQMLYDAQLITPEEFEGYNKLLQFNKIDMFYTTSERFENLVSGLFHIESVRCGEDYTGCQQHPLYILMKKSL
jgi:hypothetical protein